MSGREKRDREQLDPQNPSAAALRSGRGRVLDRRADAVQLTAEQLLSEAHELGKRLAGPSTGERAATVQASPALRRVEFERRVRNSAHVLGHWLKYAAWEASLGDDARARSIYERARCQAVHATEPHFWRTYAAFEQRLGRVAASRNVLERAVAVLPTEDVLWLDYVMLLVAVSDAAVRGVCARWLECTASPATWEFCILLMLCLGAPNDARDMLAQYPTVHNTLRAWLFYAAVEMQCLHDEAQAVAVLHTAQRALPAGEAESPGLLAVMGDALRLLGRIEDARVAFDSAIANYGAADSVGDFSDPRSEISLQALRRRREALNRAHNDVNSSRALACSFLRQDARYFLQQQAAVTHSRPLLGAYVETLAWLEMEASSGAVTKGQNESDVLVDAYESALFGSRGLMRTLCSASAQEERSLAFERHLLGVARLCECYALTLEQQHGDIPGAIAILSRALDILGSSSVPLPTAACLWISLAELHLRQENLDIAREVLVRGMDKLRPPCNRPIHQHLVELERALWHASASSRRLNAAVDRFIADFPADATLRVWCAGQLASALGPEAGDGLLQRALADEALCDKTAVWLALVEGRVHKRDLAGARAVYRSIIDHSLASARRGAAVAVSGSEASEWLASAITELRDAHEMYHQFESVVGGWAEDMVASARKLLETSARELLQNGASVEAVQPLAKLWGDFERDHGDEHTVKHATETCTAPAKIRSKLLSAAHRFA